VTQSKKTMDTYVTNQMHNKR